MSKINYSKNILSNETGTRKHIVCFLEEYIKKNEIIGKYVVELGSGLGNNLLPFATNNSILGVEGLSDAAELADISGIRTICANLDFELPDDAKIYNADYILILDVLEHLVSPQVLVKKLFRDTKSGARVLINVPNHFDLNGRLKILFGSGIDSNGYFRTAYDWDYPHLRFFRRSSVQKMFEESGFSVRNDYTSYFPSFPRLSFFANFIPRNFFTFLSSRWPDLFSCGFLIEFVKK